MGDSQKIFDLEERTARFGEDIIKLIKSIRLNAINTSTITQTIRSSGSVGANYCEATEAESKKDFIHKISIVKRKLKRLVIGSGYC